ncbi:hypothetical protein ALP29_201830 [Pseudomonas syringae pv. avii]|uniref:Uncharacterized protein n=1 Tax=Pseudomonas syringae pv. avii TaxID=663959 RepID=A0A3M5VKB4_PSESX|nr:hypothetical protein ALP29_201830 [Pseudomonas syringae pv. avii]
MAALAQKLKARLTISRKGRITIQTTWAFGSLTVTACSRWKKTAGEDVVRTAPATRPKVIEGQVAEVVSAAGKRSGSGPV